MRAIRSFCLVGLVLGVCGTHAGAESDRDRWERHYELLMKHVSDMPKIEGKGTPEVLQRVERAQAAVPGLRAALIARPAAWRVLDIMIGCVMWAIAAGLIWGELS